MSGPPDGPACTSCNGAGVVVIPDPTDDTKQIRSRCPRCQGSGDEP